ncbi:o-succinylbenzoate synthase [Staphylococcus shinii]|uniref:o-succinylbenzoate synthase n=1 Tax=Staphylococcus shinii TaxID=2912228 RepID=UPI003F876C49
MKIVDMHLYLYDERFNTPIITPKIKLEKRKALFVALVTDNNVYYYGECNAFETDWYTNETIDEAQIQVKEWFESIQDIAFYTFDDIISSLNHLSKYPATRSMIVMACYQMFFKLTDFSVAYGATVSGLAEENILQLSQTRPQRVKIKWSDSILDDIKTVEKLSFKPDIVVDANESISEAEITKLTTIGNNRLLYIEEPFKSLEMLKQFYIYELPPVAIDEKADTVNNILEAIDAYAIAVVVLKPFRLGGIDKVLDIIKALSDKNVKIVIGGMYEYGLSRYFTAMLAQLCDYPSDITPEGYYFEKDIVDRAGILKGGSIYFEPPKVKSTRLTRIY